MYLGGKLVVHIPKVKKSISTDDFLELYRKGKKDFSELTITEGRFENCDQNAVAKPIYLQGIKCINTVFRGVTFNNVKIQNSRLAGSVFEEPTFTSSKLENVDARMLTIQGGRMYYTTIDNLDLRYSSILHFEIELCKIRSGGLILGNMDISGINFLDKILTNFGLENVKIGDETKMSERQKYLFGTMDVDISKGKVLPNNELLSVRRSRNYLQTLN